MIGILFILACGSTPETEVVNPTKEQLSTLNSEIDQGNILVKVEVSPDRVRLGDEVDLSLIVQSTSSVDVEMPPFGEALGRMSISDFKPREGVADDSRFSMEYRQVYGLQPNRSGRVVIPALRVGFRVEQGDWQEILTDELELIVDPIISGDSALVYQSIRPKLEPLKEYSIWLPVFLVGSGLIVLGGMFLYNRSAVLPSLKTPYEEACISLDNMILAEDNVDQWYTGLSHILRMYLENTWSISALEQTTEELETTLPILFSQHPTIFSPSIQETLLMVLRQCDGVKFAGQSVDLERALKDHQVVRNLIQELFQRLSRVSEEGSL